MEREIVEILDKRIKREKRELKKNNRIEGLSKKELNENMVIMDVNCDIDQKDLLAYYFNSRKFECKYLSQGLREDYNKKWRARIDARNNEKLREKHPCLGDAAIFDQEIRKRWIELDRVKEKKLCVNGWYRN